MSTNKRLKPPTGQELADELAMMLDAEHIEWPSAHSHEDFWLFNGKIKVNTQHWQPHLSYDQCRIVEDWVDSMLPISRRYHEILDGLAWDTIPSKHSIRTTPLQRCAAAWLAYHESKLKAAPLAQKTP